MEKLILHDNTEIVINDGMTQDSFSCVMNAEKLKSMLTKENLSAFELQTADGQTMAKFVDKQVSMIVTVRDVLVVHLVDVDTEADEPIDPEIIHVDPEATVTVRDAIIAQSAEVKALKSQLQASIESNVMLEDCITEMAEIVYA